MSPLAWLASKLFGFVASPAGGKVLDELNREAKDYLDKLQEDSPPVPLPYAAVRHQQQQIASAAHAFPPSCPPSQAPSAPPSPLAPPSEPPPPVSMSIDPPWHQASVRYESPPPTPRPLPARHLSRASSGPPPRMSPPPPLPPPPPRYERAGVPRPSRRKP